MKKTFLVLMVMLCAVIAAQAQNLTGKTWVYNTNGHNEDNFTAQLVFNDDNTMVMTLSGDFEDVGQVKVTLPGTYKKHTRRLCIKLDRKNVDIDLSSLANDESITEDYLKQIKDNFKQQAIKDKSLSKKQMMRIKKFTESRLELVDSKGVSMVLNAQ